MIRSGVSSNLINELFFLFFCVWYIFLCASAPVYGYVCVCLQLPMYEYMCAWKGQRSSWNSFLYRDSPYWEKASHWPWRPSILFGCLASELQRSSCLDCISVMFTSASQHSSLGVCCKLYGLSHHSNPRTVLKNKPLGRIINVVITKTF